MQIISPARPPLIVYSAKPNFMLTGSTVDTIMATVPIPAHQIGPGGTVEVIALYTWTSSVNQKTMRIKLGGLTFYLMNNTAANPGYYAGSRIYNNSDEQSYNYVQANTFYGVIGNGLQNNAVDTRVAVNLDFNGQLALGTETMALRNYTVKIFPGY